MSILDRISDLRPVTDHDGRSGANIEVGRLDGRFDVYVKTTEVATDIGQLLTGDARRELWLWERGFFDSLPPGVGTAIVGIEDLQDRLVTVTRDLGRHVLSWDRRLTRAEVQRTFGAMTSMHRANLGTSRAHLCPLEQRIALFAPARVPALAGANEDLVAAVARGHELLAELVPADVADAVHATYANPQPLADSMAQADVTLLHGDFFLPNVALEPDLVTPLDWGLATSGPASIDLVTFCVGAMSNVQLSRSALLAEARTACRDIVDEVTFRQTEFWALLELGWNKALDAVDHPDPTKRATERGDLDFWVDRARLALDAGLIPSQQQSDDTRFPPTTRQPQGATYR